MELFVYQEKLLNIVCNIFFIEIQKNRQANLRELKKRSSNFPLLHKFCELCEQLRNDKKYNRVMSIRDDETHNMSQIDSFFLDLENHENGICIVNKGYKISARVLREEYIYVMEQLINVRNIVQEILDTYDLSDIYFKLNSQGEKIFVN